MSGSLQSVNVRLAQCNTVVVGFVLGTWITSDAGFAVVDACVMKQLNR